jgi:hypothetical protein
MFRRRGSKKLSAARTADQESNNAIVAAIARIVHGPVKAPPAVSRKTHRAHFGIFGGWLCAAWQREREYVA